MAISMKDISEDVAMVIAAVTAFCKSKCLQCTIKNIRGMGVRCTSSVVGLAQRMPFFAQVSSSNPCET